MSLRLVACLLAWLLPLTPAATEALPTVRVGVLQFGTVSWELDVVVQHRLDQAAGFRLEVLPLASNNATAVSLQGGAVDVIVTDWIWVSRQRAEGRPYVFFPYSLTVGGLVVDPRSGIDALPDLRGRKLGVAGGPVDKTWLLLQAYARRAHGLDLAAAAEVVFAAPPVLNQLMLKGELDAVVTYWHYAARLLARGQRVLLGAEDVLRALGVEAAVPLLGWVFDERWAVQNAPAVEALLRASYAAKERLLQSDEEWTRLAPLTRAEDASTLQALRDGYRAGVPRRFGAAEIAAAREVFAHLAAEGGAKLVGRSAALSEGTFWTRFSIGTPD